MKTWLLIILLSTVSSAHLFGGEIPFTIKRPIYKLAKKERIKKTRNIQSGIKHTVAEDDILAQEMLKCNIRSTISLHKAIETSQDIQTIAEIIAKTHNADAIDKHEATPLLCAIERSTISPFAPHEERTSQIARTKAIINMLLQQGAHINRTDAHGNTPLFKATNTIDCPSEIIAHLIQCGANVNHKNNKSNTPLLDLINNNFACGFGSKLEHIKTLLHNDTDVNAQNIDGNTACHLLMNIAAGPFIKESTLSTLFDYGADTEIYNNNEQTCIDIAMDNETIVNDGFDVVTFIEDYHNN